MRPTQDPKYESVWADFDRYQQNSNQSYYNYLAKPSERYSSKYCYYCKKGWVKGRRRTRQHLLPKRRGGLLKPDNVRWCCYLCNQLLAMVDDCPLILETYRTIIQDSPLRYLPLSLAFKIHIDMVHHKYNQRVEYTIIDLVKKLKNKRQKYIARKILIYMKKTFPAAIQMHIPKKNIPFVFSE